MVLCERERAQNYLIVWFKMRDERRTAREREEMKLIGKNAKLTL